MNKKKYFINFDNSFNNEIIHSNAKINLFLKIGFKKNLLHNIYSLFLPVNLYDTMYIYESKRFEVNYFKIINKENKIFEKLYIKDNILDKVNIVFDIEPKFKIDIVKNIPIGGGLGGASSNAASYIKFLVNNRLIKIKSKKKFLEKLVNIGSDVPFFYFNKPAMVYKTGSHIERFMLNIPLYFVVLYPDRLFSTKEMYEVFDKNFYNNIDLEKIYKKTKKILQKIKKNDFYFIYELENDFDKVIKLLYPEIFKLKNLFENSNMVLFTGSGSSLFGIYNDWKNAKKDFFLLKKKFERVFFLSWIK